MSETADFLKSRGKMTDFILWHLLNIVFIFSIFEMLKYRMKEICFTS